MNTYDVFHRSDPHKVIMHVAGRNRGNARYNALLDLRDPCPDMKFADLIVRRTGGFPDCYDYVRRTYGVPARVGGRVRWQSQERTILYRSGSPCYVYLDIDGRIAPIHPKESGLEYVPEGGRS